MIPDFLSTIRALILSVVAKADTAQQEKLELKNENASLKAAIAALEEKQTEGEAQLSAFIAEITETYGPDAEAEGDAEGEVSEENPTPAADAIIEAANEAEAPNSPAVQKAIDSTVGTSEFTPVEAVEEAIEMITAEPA